MKSVRNPTMKIKHNQTIILALTLCLFSIVTTTQAQQSKNKGTSFIEAGGGISANGVMFYGGYLARIGHDKENTSWYIKATALYETGSGRNINYSTIGGDVVAGYTLFTISPSLSINLKAGLTVTDDKLTTPLTEKDEAGNTIQNDHSLLKLGVLGGGEAQWQFAKKLSFIAGGDQRYLFGSDTWGHVRWLGYTGVRYTLK